jgi:DNA polymerase III subunit gamma/tau
VLGRAWQMLLKGIQEVESAPDRRAAAEMVLIRLCYVADLPPPGELVRTLAAGPAAVPSGAASAPPRPLAPSSEPPPPTGGGMRAAAGATPIAAPLSARAAAPPAMVESPPEMPADFRAVVALAREAREALLAAQLLHHVHLVRFAPPVIEIRPEPEAPRDLAARLSRLLQAATGVRWTIALAAEPGEPTLAEQEQAEEIARRAAVSRDPLVRAILAAFPGAEIAAVRDIDVQEIGAQEIDMQESGTTGAEVPGTEVPETEEALAIAPPSESEEEEP